MKTRSLLLTLILWVGISRIAHSQNNCNQPPCENGTNTNPNTQYTSPQTGDFRQNTFNWRDANIPVDKNSFSFNQYLNPFLSQFDYLFGLGTDKLGVGRDNRPEDGWELIKQDFGYSYNNGQWNGNTLPVIINNQPIAEPSIFTALVGACPVYTWVIPNKHFSKLNTK